MTDAAVGLAAPLGRIDGKSVLSSQHHLPDNDGVRLGGRSHPLPPPPQGDGVLCLFALPVTEAVRVQLYRMASSPNTFPGPMVQSFFPCLVTSTIPSARGQTKRENMVGCDCYADVSLNDGGSIQDVSVGKWEL